MIFALALILCLCSVAAQHTPAADGLAGRARRNLRSLQDVSEEPCIKTTKQITIAASEDDEVPLVDFLADQSMSMLIQPPVDDEVEKDNIVQGREMTEHEFVENYRYLATAIGSFFCTFTFGDQ